MSNWSRFRSGWILLLTLSFASLALAGPTGGNTRGKMENKKRAIASAEGEAPLAPNLTAEEREFVLRAREMFMREANLPGPSQHMQDKMQDQATPGQGQSLSEDGNFIHSMLPRLDAKSQRILRVLVEDLAKQQGR
ncbi:hypothetical protein WDW86_10785 [Bdellovibrionota bacterium FG-2]